MSLSILASRATSAFPISIGTSLALESCYKGTQPPFDPNRVIPQVIDVSKYGSVWINLLTVVRNIYSSVPSADAKALHVRDIVDVMANECDLIKEIFTKNTPGIKVVFYQCDYDGIKSNYPRAIPKESQTTNQVMFDKLCVSVLKTYLRTIAEDDVKTFALFLSPDLFEKAIIITHMTHDLLSHEKFHTLDLLESHTGALKSKARWYTKFAKSVVSDGIERIAFNRVTWQFFGDGQLVSPYPNKARKMLLDFAKEKDWTALTTLERMRYTLSDFPDRFLGETLKLMF